VTIEALPEGVIGELIAGQFHTEPSPPGLHAVATSRVLWAISARYHGPEPDQWWVLRKPELHFVRDAEVLVPDVAGWRRERMPVLPRDQRVEVVPDWVCEVPWPATASRDREVKMPVYAAYGVPYAWILDPKAGALEAYVLRGTRWVLEARFGARDSVCATPFEAARLRLEALWA